MKWRLINTGLAGAATNMAIDEAILVAYSEGKVPPTLRVYGWRPAAISIGYFQRIQAEIDLAECQRRGVDVVRRLTGGRAVLHDAELTYSIVVGADDPSIPPTITASYRHFSTGLLAGLARLGIKAQLSMPRAAYGQIEKKRSRSSAACFDSPSHYEIVYEGRKLAGSAQVRKNGVILQHGSILLRFDAENMAALLRYPSPEMRQTMTEMLAHRVISLEQILGRPVNWRETADAISGVFGEALGVGLEAGELTAEETDAAHRLAAGKYGDDSWNLLR
ncbi:MAG: lipoate--protein ligase family protein [Negativicutes bacterium]|nr:lipoate--protein ligase family protein [Negativicutes bacterium]